MSTVNPVYSNSASTAAGATSVLPAQTLNQQDFLNLLVAQMSAQDPMNPVSNSDFAAQMAQFSALQTSQATQTDIANLYNSQQLQQANGLLGRSVTLQKSDGSTLSGTVSSVQVNSGTPQLVVNGSPYNLSQVINIASAPASQ